MRRYCRTNLDLCNEVWPDLEETPQVGAYVESKRGLRLKVVAVTYKQVATIIGPAFDHQKETIVEVELWLSPGEFASLDHFRKWYESWRQTR